jgi:hypothetical protein
VDTKLPLPLRLISQVANLLYEVRKLQESDKVTHYELLNEGASIASVLVWSVTFPEEKPGVREGNYAIFSAHALPKRRRFRTILRHMIVRAQISTERSEQAR